MVPVPQRSDGSSSSDTRRRERTSSGRFPHDVFNMFRSSSFKLQTGFHDFASELLLLSLSPGVKNADENELKSIASPPEETHVYVVADFGVMSDIVEGLTKTVCDRMEQLDKQIRGGSFSVRVPENTRVPLCS